MCSHSSQTAGGKPLHTGGMSQEQQKKNDCHLQLRLHLKAKCYLADKAENIGKIS